MRSGILVLAACLLLVLAASAARAEGVSGSRDAAATASEPWIPCAAGDYERSYAPPLSPAPQKPWYAVVAAYAWGSSIKGDSWVDGQKSDIDVPFKDLFDKLDSAFMGYAEVGYGRWSFAVDASYVSLSDSFAGLRGLPIDLEIDQTIVDLRLGFTVWCRNVGSSQWGRCCHPRKLTLDAVVGARYWDVETELSTTLPTVGVPLKVSDDESWWDPYVGARLRWPFAKRWAASLYGDVGGFGIGDASDLTWQIQAYLRFYVTRGLFLAVGYRALGVDRVQGSGTSKNGVDATYHGPVVGLGYVF